MPALEVLVAGRIGLQQIQAGQGGGTAERVGREAVAMEEGVAGRFADEAAVDPFAGHRDPHRQEAAGEAFGQGHQIRLNSSPLAGKQGAGASEAGHHLIGDQQGAAGAHALLHPPQEGRPHQPHAAGALDQRLKDHGSGGGVECLLELIERLALARLHALVVPVGVRPAHMPHLEQQRLVGGGEQRALPEGHRAHGVAVIGALEGDQLAPLRRTRASLPVPPPLPGHLQGHLNGRGAVIGEEQPLQASERAQACGQEFGGLVAEVGEDHLLQLQRLPGDRRGDRRFGVAVQRHPPAADGINQPPPIGQLQLAAPCRAHQQGFRGGGHLGGGMPEVGVPAHSVVLPVLVSMSCALTAGFRPVTHPLH